MEYRRLGRTGTRVSTLCLGAMNFNEANRDEGVATIHAALDAGVNFIDTANVYSRGQSEEVVGVALRDRRDKVVLATKVFGTMDDDDVNGRGNSRRHIKQQCEASLRRLQTDYIDLYQLHRPDGDTPIEESLSALDDLVRAGKIHYVGISTFPAWETMQALAVAAERGLSSAPVSEQPPYNILDRRLERDVIPLALNHGLGILPWSPLASGILTGKYADDVPEGTRVAAWGGRGFRPDFDAAVAATNKLAKVAADAGLTLVQLALAWLNHQPAVTSPIIGPRDRAQLADNLAAADVALSPETLVAVDEISPGGQAIFPLG